MVDEPVGQERQQEGEGKGNPGRLEDAAPPAALLDAPGAPGQAAGEDRLEGRFRKMNGA